MNTWLRDIERATTEAEVVSRTRDYVSLWSPPELAPLPEDCRTITIREGSDIPRWKERLQAERARVRDRLAYPQRFDDLVSYLEHASARLGEIERPAS